MPTKLLPKRRVGACLLCLEVSYSILTQYCDGKSSCFVEGISLLALSE